MMTKAFWNPIRTENRKEVGASCNCISVNNLVHRLPCLTVPLKMNSPHAGVRVRLISNVGYEPSDKCT